jgi:hypothetical protein
VVGALFGLGGAFKLYPVAFVAPFALAFLVDAALAWPDRLRRAGAAVGAAVAVLVAANLPFALIAPASWFSVIRFQGIRDVDPSTLSVWYWGLQPWSASTDPQTQHTLNLLATAATAVTVVAVLVAGVVIGIRRGRMPWIETSAALLCAYLVSNKVDSLQYVLWLLPFFVVVRVRIGWALAYIGANLLLFFGWFRSFYLHAVGTTGRTYADEALSVGIWGQAILLVVLVFVFLRARAVDRDVLDDRGAPGVTTVDRGRNLEVHRTRAV